MLQKESQSGTIKQRKNIVSERKPSIFQITAIILTAILFVFIIISICVIIDLKHKTDETKDKNEQIENLESRQEKFTKIQTNYLKNIKKFN